MPLYITKGRANPAVYTWPFPAVQAGTAWVSELQVWNSIGVPVALDGYAFSARISDLRSDHVIATASVDSPGTGRIRWFFADGALTRFGDDVYRFTLDANVNGATQRLIDSRLPVQGGSVTVDAGDFIEITDPGDGGGGGIIPPPPPVQLPRVISSMSPTTVPVSTPTLVTLVGLNFGATDKVVVGTSAPITPTSRTATLITFQVSASFPSGTQPVTVVVAPNYLVTDPLASASVTLTIDTAVAPPVDFPDATDTGPTGTLTTFVGNKQSTTAGDVIENLHLTNGYVHILHANCTVRNCLIDSQEFFGIDADNQAGTLIEDCKITGIGGTAGVVLAYGTIRRCDVSGYGTGVLFAGGPNLIEDNYIHGLTRLSGTEYLCCKTGAASNTTIQRNSLFGREDAQVALVNDYNAITNVKVLSNNFQNEASMTPVDYNVAVNDGGSSGQPITLIEIAYNAGTQGTLAAFSVSPGSSAQVNIHQNFGAGGGGPIDPPDPGGPPVDTPIVFDPASTTAAYMAANTGVIAGTVLRPGPNPATIVNGQVLEGYIWTNGLNLPARTNVTLYNCKITGGDWGGIDGGYCTGLVIRRCTIVGPGHANYNYAILSGQNATVERCDVSVHTHAIGPGGGTSGLVKHCYVHDPWFDPDPTHDPHVGGISIKGGGTVASPSFSNLIVEENLVYGADTSCCFIKDDFGPCYNTIVRRNRFLNAPGHGAPGYTCYSGSSGGNGGVHGTQYLDNVMQIGGYGYWSVDPLDADCHLAGNVDYLTGANIDALR